MPRTFYIAHLVSPATGEVLAREEIWNIEGEPIGEPQALALNCAAFFNNDEHDQNPADNIIRLYGPYTFDPTAPAHVFTIADDERPDAPDFWTATEYKEAPQYLATFQGEAWIMDHAIFVDDSRYSYPVTATELMLSDIDLDGLAQAAAAPAIVKEWSGPFTVTLEPLPGADLANADVNVFHKDALDDDYAATFAKPWLVQYPDGLVLQFDDETAACTHQGLHRQAMGLNEETGEPY